MTARFDDLLRAFEVHSVAGIRAALDKGLDVHSPIEGQTPVNALIEMYYRSDRFVDSCTCCCHAVQGWTTRRSRRCCSTTPSPSRPRCARIDAC